MLAISEMSRRWLIRREHRLIMSLFPFPQYAPNPTGPWAWPNKRCAGSAWSRARFSSSSRFSWSWRRRWRFAATSTVSIQTCCVSSSTAASPHRPTICFLAITSIEVRNLAKFARPSIVTNCPFSGKQSLETICLLLAYKIKYPENFFLLRGNHECASINRIYGNKTKIDWEIRIGNWRALRFFLI